MLVLTRREHQAIELSNGVRVTVVSIEGGKVRLGFEAPKEVKIAREEVSQRDRDIESGVRVPPL